LFRARVLPLRSHARRLHDARPISLVSACDQVTGTAPPVGALEPYMFIASDAGTMQAAGMRDGVLMGPGSFTSATADEYVEVAKQIGRAHVNSSHQIISYAVFCLKK